MESVHFAFDAIGTKWNIDIYSSLTSAVRQDVLKKIKDVIEEFDSVYSRFRKGSLVTKMSEKSGTYILPSHADSLFSLYEKLYNLTNGLFTPLVGQLLSDAGYDIDYSLMQKKTLKKPSSWSEVMEYSSGTLRLKKPTLLDFGAAGKGYLIDIVGNLLNREKIHSYCIDAGGDILYKNKENKTLRVGLENPTDFKEVVGVVPILNQSICGSSGNRRKWGKFHHIINPHHLSSPMHLLAVWVIAKEAILADALTTCLFFVQPEILKKEYNFEYLLLYPDASVEKSPGFLAEMFIK